VNRREFIGGSAKAGTSAALVPLTLTFVNPDAGRRTPTPFEAGAHRPDYSPFTDTMRDAYRSGERWLYNDDYFDRIGNPVRVVIAFNPPPQLTCEGGHFVCDGELVRYAIIGHSHTGQRRG